MAERKGVLLRLDPAVHDALARWAADELRSTNAQIEFLLRRALVDAGRMPGGGPDPSTRTTACWGLIAALTRGSLGRPEQFVAALPCGPGARTFTWATTTSSTR